jgi:hypothetical protein
MKRRQRTELLLALVALAFVLSCAENRQIALDRWPGLPEKRVRSVVTSIAEAANNYQQAGETMSEFLREEDDAVFISALAVYSLRTEEACYELHDTFTDGRCAAAEKYQACWCASTGRLLVLAKAGRQEATRALVRMLEVKTGNAAFRTLVADSVLRVGEPAIPAVQDSDLDESMKQDLVQEIRRLGL